MNTVRLDNSINSSDLWHIAIITVLLYCFLPLPWHFITFCIYSILTEKNRIIPVYFKLQCTISSKMTFLIFIMCNVFSRFSVFKRHFGRDKKGFLLYHYLRHVTILNESCWKKKNIKALSNTINQVIISFLINYKFNILLFYHN